MWAQIANRRKMVEPVLPSKSNRAASRVEETSPVKSPFRMAHLSKDSECSSFLCSLPRQ